jgi:hypothetical protein
VVFGGMSNVSIESEFFLDGNKFFGTVPHDLSKENLKFIDLHDNELSGKLNTSLWNVFFAGTEPCWQPYNRQNSSRNLWLDKSSASRYVKQQPYRIFTTLQFYAAQLC